MSDRNRGLIVLLLGLAAYFLCYPDDAQSIATLATTFLSVTTAVSPWLYGVIAVAILANAIIKTGRGPGRT
jgi:hypothetical protein